MSSKLYFHFTQNDSNEKVIPVHGLEAGKDHGNRFPSPRVNAPPSCTGKAYLNSILENVIAGNYTGGWHAFQRCPDPTPEDQRWAGYCLFSLQRPLEARDLLLQALGQGCEAAAIELATLHRSLGENDVARNTLSRFDPTSASAFDQALAAREQGMIAYAAGDLQRASQAFETAWHAALQTPQGKVLVSGIALMLGRVLADRGQSQRALHHLDRAFESASAGKQINVLVVRAECLIHAGRFEEAQSALEAATANASRLPAALPGLHYVRGLLARARGQYREAEGHLRQASALAQDANETETELHAELDACAVAVCLNQPSKARAHLARAKCLTTDAKSRALVDFREGMVLAQAGEQKAIPTLERALETFEQLGLERNRGWVRLHLADANLRLGHLQKAEDWLNAATDTRYGLGVGAALSLELRSLKPTLEHLEACSSEAYARVLYDDLHALDSSAPIRIELRTLGQARWLADGQKVRLNAGLAVTIEVISYLMTHPGRSLERILADVFPDVSPERAKNYFHLVRSEFKRVIPGASIPFNEASRTYSVDMGGLHLDWDRAELRRALCLGGDEGLLRVLEIYKGAFLPHSENEWALAERTDLEWAVLKLGLEVMDRHFNCGEYQTCLDFAHRLLGICPLNESVNSYVVRATRQLKGVTAARQELQRTNDRFINEVGEAPLFLEDLKADLVLVG